MRRSIVLSLPPQLVFPAVAHSEQTWAKCYKTLQGCNFYNICPWSAFSMDILLMGRLSTIDLLIKVTCFVKMVTNIYNIKRN